ncbi:MAG: GntR family transcriptional regulator [Burkholderiales bacterium]|nr:GntR family transcriptional regulator [Burkholderiales bacterium]
MTPPAKHAPRPATKPSARRKSRRRAEGTQREWVYDRLKHGLMSGAFVPGQKVTLARIASELGVSMMPVREALRRLAAERALTMRPNRSVTVPRLSRAEILSIRAIRQMLEGHAAATATSLITEDEIERLAELQGELAGARARGDAKGVLAVNESFHFLVYNAACIPVLVDIIATLWLHSAPTLYLFFHAGKQPRDYSERQNRNNLALIAALKRRDPEGARRAIEDEIVEGSRLLDRLMREAKWDEAAAIVPLAGRRRRRHAPAK